MSTPKLFYRVKDSFKKYPILFFFISFFLLHVIGLLYTCDIQEGLFVIEKKLSLLVFPIIISDDYLTKNTDTINIVKSAFYSLVGACMVCVLYATYVYVFTGENVFYWNELVKIISFHPNYLALYITLINAVLIKELINQWSCLKSGSQILCVIIELFLITFIILLSTRLQTFLFFVVLIGMVFYQTTKKNNKLLGPTISLIVILIISLVMIFNVSYLQRFKSINSFNYQIDADPKTFNNLTVRLGIWECSWSIIEKNYLLGVGTGDAKSQLINSYKKLDFKYGYLDKLNAHNQYISTLIKIGFVGFLILILHLAIPFIHRKYKYSNGYKIFVVLFGISFLTESMLSVQKGVVLFSIVNSLFAFNRFDFSRTYLLDIFECENTSENQIE
ncbi:O-antigen ligase [Fulvivirga sp. M361]|uniref:O-antigen ligase family protein n=1 Tax=Fulvivirga sp. M361 TaxID=2594266 RepID=UPI001629046B|nr:O-antigen ligase family protein [Fulvivirga sp. M361]